jgi:hypothetical protein
VLRDKRRAAGGTKAAEHGNVIAGVKMMIGAMVGQTLDDSIERRISV